MSAGHSRMKTAVSAGLVSALAISAPQPTAASDLGRAVGAIIGGVVSGAIQRDQQQRQRQQQLQPRQSAPAVSPEQHRQTRELQQALNHFEFSAGQADGVMGPNTRGAIRRYQAAMGYSVTGELAEPQRDFLMASYHRAQHSGSIAPYDRILAAEGPQAVLMAFRDEQPGARPEAPALHAGPFDTAQAAAQQSGSDTLLFPDGTYTTDPRYCSLTPEESSELGDRIATVRQQINGPRIERGYEVSCEIDSVRAEGDLLTVQAGCMAEGYAEPREWSLEPVSDTAFIERGGFLDGQRFDLCAPDADEAAQPRGAASDFVPPQDARWVQVASRRTLDAARDVARREAIAAAAERTGTKVRIFRTRDGWYAVTAMILGAVEHETGALEWVIENDDLPADSLLARGESYAEEFAVEGSTPPAPAFTYTETLRESTVFSRLGRDGEPIHDPMRPVPAGDPVAVWGQPDERGDCRVDGHEGIFMQCADLAAFADGAADPEPQPDATVTDAPPVFGPHAVISLDATSGCLRHIDWPVFRECLEEAGAGAAGIAAARELSSGDGPAFLSAYWPTGGPVDAAEIQVPSAGTTARQGLVRDGAGFEFVGLDATAAQDAASRRLQRRYPDAVSYNPTWIVGHRQLGEGGQRFILATLLTDGCRACDLVAMALGYRDFRDGELVEEDMIGWAPQRGALRGDDAGIVARLRDGDALEAQIQLNRLGYIAGPMDGALGPMTRSALDAFRRDYCLEPGAGWPDSATIEALADNVSEIVSGQALGTPPAPCGPGAPDRADPAGAGEGLTWESAGPDVFNIFTELVGDYCVGRDCPYYEIRPESRCEGGCDIDGVEGEYVAAPVSADAAQSLAERATGQVRMVSRQGVPQGRDGEISPARLATAATTRVYRRGCETAACDSQLYAILGEGFGFILDVPGRDEGESGTPAPRVPEDAARDSVYSEISPADCDLLYSPPADEPGDAAVQLCAGPEGHEVVHADLHLRMHLDYRRAGLHETPSGVDWRAGMSPGFPAEGFAEFNRVHETIEWRRAEIDGRRIPFATIHRWFVQLETSQGPRERPILVVSTVAGEADAQSCMVGYIDAAETADANEMARRLADARAPGFECGVDEMQAYGTTTIETPRPFRRGAGASVDDGR